MLYRLELPTMTLAFKDNHYAATALLPGSVVEVLRPDVDDRFWVVKAFQEELLVFATDLNDRGRPVDRIQEVTTGHTISPANNVEAMCLGVMPAKRNSRVRATRAGG